MLPFLLLMFQCAAFVDTQGLPELAASEFFFFAFASFQGNGSCDILG